MPTNRSSLDLDADGTNPTWDQPPYKSPEFIEYLAAVGQSLETFRGTTAYRHAVVDGLIVDDAWVDAADPELDHECDLFLLSSHEPYTADRALTAFAGLGARNIHGWGIGSYRDGRAEVLRQATPALAGRSLSREFAAAVAAVSSPIILGHLRLMSHGTTRPQNNHPFMLNFLGDDWMLIHNGTARRYQQLVPPHQRLLRESDSDTPRVFEYLRQHMVDYCEADPRRSLIRACQRAFKRLVRADPAGLFNLVLSNGHLSFVFMHWRPFYLLHRQKDAGDVAIISTLKLTDDETWICLDQQPRMLVFSGPSLIENISLSD